ncbi:hypothetical protein Y032_0373g180 [Ancylostoma ceylanicum]|uniref:Uncharacterized protein n=1 Tax=Ancylostoma ceylanicum TaxID=53326 RepID=A0A016RV19_9BILA|nr:hypothetical protein Y032_0373g180 [Ancylostoma ceylanicum]
MFSEFHPLEQERFVDYIHSKYSIFIGGNHKRLQTVLCNPSRTPSTALARAVKCSSFSDSHSPQLFEGAANSKANRFYTRCPERDSDNRAARTHPRAKTPRGISFQMFLSSPQFLLKLSSL